MSVAPPNQSLGSGARIPTLRAATADLLPRSIARPAYDPAAVTTGVVHIGPGAFHRAHQAAFLDRLLASDPRWGVAAVSLRSGTVTDALARQEGRYVLDIKGDSGETRLLATHRAWFGPSRSTDALSLFDDPAVALVTVTVTEKGYCLGPDGALDVRHPHVRADLSGATRPSSLPGWLTAVMRRRRDGGLPPPVVMSCDNLSANGATLKAVVIAMAAEREPDLARWIEDRATFPGTVVDSITPAMSRETLDRRTARVGVRDDLAVEREAFAMWVIEDAGAPLPDLAATGAIMSRDVASWELAKLRILNGAHSALAYHGLLRGHETVAEAIADPVLLRFLQAMIAEEIAPMLRAPDGIDLSVYAAQVLTRFANPLIVHRLDQIAADGSHKLPYRLVAPLAERLTAGRSAPLLTRAIAGWMAFCIRSARSGVALEDPMADRLLSAAGAPDPLDAARGLLGQEAIFPGPLRGSEPLASALADEVRRLLAVDNGEG